MGDYTLAGIDLQSIQDSRLLSECYARFVICGWGTPNMPGLRQAIDIDESISGTFPDP